MIMCTVYKECFRQAYRLSHGGNVEEEEIVAWDETLRRCDRYPHVERIRIG